MDKAYSAKEVVAGAAPYKVGDILGKQHNSQETAYLVSDYPWGSKLRCNMRVWIEFKKGSGMRFCTQTEDPRNGRWNAPKKSTYSKALVAIFDEQGHLTQRAWSEYDQEKAAWFRGLYEEHLPHEVLEQLVFFEAYYNSMEAAKKEGEAKGADMSYGTQPYVVAHKAAMLAAAKAVKAHKK